MHTPGPWKAENLDDEPYGRITIHRPGAGRSIATLWQDDAPVPEWNAEQWANARLIAAAPELLDALKELTEAACEEWYSTRPCLARALIAIQQAES